MGELQSIRRNRLAVLAMSDTSELVKCWKTLGVDPEFTMPRAPQTGIVGLRGRIGGGGDAFNFGEATITRATVKLASGSIGHAYALGRDHTKAKLSAIIDALCLDDDWSARIEDNIITPLRNQIKSRDERRAAETAATKVDFFTMVRGED
jgi:alpha-D-ribose 1-methylphosphonate 5-triphosphate synthase subunit PhnG